MENFSRKIENLLQNKFPTSQRFLRDMESVLKDDFEKEENQVVYDVYRDLGFMEDRDVVEKLGLYYDITVLHRENLKSELPKTFGHYHKYGGIEISESVSGTGWWLMQKYTRSPDMIEEVYLVKAEPNEKVIYPPGFGHIIINPNPDEDLINSNWRNPETESDYSQIASLGGFCYYVTRNENGKIEFIKNENYKKVPELIILKPKEIPELGITFDKPLYELFRTPKSLDILKKTKHYEGFLTISGCFNRVHED
ncbi:glucose-6-phosphate isomerase family protein [Patescibacteria group bacterium]